jgi:hypothetical protein
LPWRGELGLEIDVDGAGDVSGLVVGAPVRVAERPADVEDDDGGIARQDLI